jgi:hypothetical protein
MSAEIEASMNGYLWLVGGDNDKVPRQKLRELRVFLKEVYAL